MKTEKIACTNDKCTKKHKSKSQAVACCSKETVKAKMKFNRNKGF